MPGMTLPETGTKPPSDATPGMGLAFTFCVMTHIGTFTFRFLGAFHSAKLPSGGQAKKSSRAIDRHDRQIAGPANCVTTCPGRHEIKCVCPEWLKIIQAHAVISQNHPVCPKVATVVLHQVQPQPGIDFVDGTNKLPDCTTSGAKDIALCNRDWWLDLFCDANGIINRSAASVAEAGICVVGVYQ